VAVGDDYLQVKSQHLFVSDLYIINKTCTLLQLHQCCASFIIGYLKVKPAICDTSIRSPAAPGAAFSGKESICAARKNPRIAGTKGWVAMPLLFKMHEI